ncbi:hypothetical protein FNF29_06524 [Cafeteria roenbergensis]|uniref:Uncharacterized protein n=1 Tax=Cafeteria roenbergensis TaxID=33653 RepID=A0A5A8C6Q9_CAFRO|nr:hypothetical protein FNF29_06524 [Cafeteria roenbergensis]|eukprot:KAA0148742.1 hypothetical protein FNF29_06524 [Cafeteria roenbergensis]
MASTKASSSGAAAGAAGPAAAPTVESLKEAGDKAYGASDFESACVYYEAAIEAAAADGSADAALAAPSTKADAKDQSLVARVHSNLAAARIKTGDVAAALASATEAVRFAPAFPRAYMRVVMALREAGDTPSALKLASWARARFPSDPSFGKLVRELNDMEASTRTLSFALDSMLGPFFAMQDAMDAGKSAGEAKEESSARAMALQAAAATAQEDRLESGVALSDAAGVPAEHSSVAVSAAHWKAVSDRLEALAASRGPAPVAALAATAVPAAESADDLPAAPKPTDSSVGVPARLELSAQLQAHARAALRAGRVALAAEALTRSLACLSLRGSVEPAERAAAERAKIAVFADKALVALLEGEFDDADDHCERVLARVARTTMQESFVLKGDAKADWDEVIEARMTAREAVALAGDGRLRAAVASARKAASLRPRDAWLRGLLARVETMRAEKAAAKAAKAAEVPGDAEGAGGGSDDDEDEDEEDEEDQEEAALQLEGKSSDPDAGVAPIKAVPGSPHNGVPVLILADTTFRLSDRVAVEYAGAALAAAGGIKGSVPVRPRVVDLRFWPFVDWEREHFVVFVVAPMRQEMEQERCMPGLMRWMASARPALAHVAYSVVSTGHSGYFPHYEQPATWIDHMMERLGAFALTEACDVDTAQHRKALDVTATKWAGELAATVQEALKAGRTSARPVSFDYLSIRLAGGRPALPAYRLAPADATVASCSILGAGSVVGRGAAAEAGAATPASIAAASAARGTGGVVADITLALSPLLPPSALAPGDAVGVIVPNDPAEVAAVLGAMGVPPSTTVPPPPWAFSQPRAAPPTRPGAWTPVLQSITAVSPLAVLDAVREATADAPADADAPPAAGSAASKRRPAPPASAAEALAALPAAPPCMRTASLTAADALALYFALGSTPPALVHSLVAMRTERGLPAFPPSVDAAVAGDPSLLAAWAASTPVATMLETMEAAATRRAGIPASILAQRVFLALGPLAAVVAPVSDSPAARAGNEITIRAELPPATAAALVPGTAVKAYPAPAVFQPEPVEDGCPLTILTAGAVGVGLARAILFPRLRSAAPGAITVVLAAPAGVDLAGVPASIDATSADEQVAAAAAVEAAVPGIAELARVASQGHFRLVVASGGTAAASTAPAGAAAAAAAGWSSLLKASPAAGAAIADAVAPEAQLEGAAAAVGSPVLYVAVGAEAGGHTAAQQAILEAISAARSIDASAAAEAWDSASTDGRVVVAAF